MLHFQNREILANIPLNITDAGSLNCLSPLHLAGGCFGAVALRLRRNGPRKCHLFVQVRIACGLPKQQLPTCAPSVHHIKPAVRASTQPTPLKLGG